MYSCFLWAGYSTIVVGCDTVCPVADLPLAETDTARPRMDMQLVLMHLAVVPAALQ